MDALGRPIYWVTMTYTARHSLTIILTLYNYSTVLYHSFVAANWNGVMINHFASTYGITHIYIQSVLCACLVHVNIRILYICIYTRSTRHYCEHSCVSTSTHKCDSSSECESIEHSIAPHSVTSDWRELQQIALWVIHLWYVCTHHKMQMKTSSTGRQCIAEFSIQTAIRMTN